MRRWICSGITALTSATEKQETGALMSITVAGGKAAAGGGADLHPARVRARPARGIRRSLVMVSTAQPMARQETSTQFSALMVVFMIKNLWASAGRWPLRVTGEL